MHRTRLSLLAVLTAALVPATSFADSAGATGTVHSLTVYETSSDNYGMANGSLFIKERKEKNKPEELREYKWGGSLCPGREMSAASIALLYHALQDRKTKVTPSYKAGNGNSRCITGFKFDRE